MTPEQRHLLATHANNAALGAYGAHLDAMRPDLPATDRAEHARRARELAGYAREILAIVREGEPVEAHKKASDSPALTEDAWFRTTLAQVTIAGGCRVDFAAAAGRANVDLDDVVNGGHVLGVADGGDIVEAFARALAQVPRMRLLLTVRPAR